MIFNCPGSSKFKQPQPQAVDCPSCGEAVEIWTDETEAICGNCKTRVRKNMEQSCLDWCAYAHICAGYKVITKGVS